MTDRFAVIGAEGFIGGELVRTLIEQGADVKAFDRADLRFDYSDHHVIDCGGITSDFRSRISDLYQAHAGRVDEFLRSCDCRSYLYMSSTRVYSEGVETSEEGALVVRPGSADNSYNISKIAGESICLMQDKAKVRVARLSNVVGRNAAREFFVTSLLLSAVEHRRVELQESLDSAKDYIDARDVCRYLQLIATRGRHRIYNVAFGQNRTHGQILNCVSQSAQFTVNAPEWPKRALAPIQISRLVAEFGEPRFSPEVAFTEALQSLQAPAAPSRSGVNE